MSALRIVDAHMHLGCPWTLFTHGWQTAEVLRLMNHLGIERAYSIHHRWLAGDLDEGRAASLEAYEQSGGRIPFMAVFDPRCEKQSLAAIDSCLGEGGFIGIKIHPSFHGIAADDASYEVIWEYAQEHNLPILSHTWSETYNPVQKLSLPRLFETHIARHPSVSFVMGHAGGPGTGQYQAAELAGKYPNVYLDIAGDVFTYDLLPRLVRNVGADRVIFGTDQPWIDPRSNLARTILSGITDEQMSLVLGENALRVFEPHLLSEGD